MNPAPSYPDWSEVITRCGIELPAWLPPHVRSFGAPARERLLAILRSVETTEKPTDFRDQRFLHAATLLAEFEPDEALVGACLPLLLDERLDALVRERLARTVAAAGERVVPLVLDAYAALSDDDAQRAGPLLLALAHCGVRDERIFEAVRDGLRRFPRQAVAAAGHYGDVRALEPILELIDGLDESELLRVDPSGADYPEDIACAVGMLGGKLTPAQQELLDSLSFSTDFEDENDEYDEEESDPFDDSDDAPAPAPRPAPNSPCWCGSERKYKKCHMAADDAGFDTDFPDSPLRPL